MPGRALAVALVLALCAPMALAQEGALRVELAPPNVGTAPGVVANATVRVYNSGLGPMLVVLSTAATTGALNVTFDATELSILPGGSAATGVRVRGEDLGDWVAVIRAQERTAFGTNGTSAANATLRVHVAAPPANATTANATAPSNTSTTNASVPPPPDPQPPASQPPPEPQSEPEPGPTPDPLPLPTAPRIPGAPPALEARRGEPASFAIRLENTADVAQTFDLTLHLPMGWTGTLDARTLDVPARAAALARGSVTPVAGARDDEGELRASGPGGSAAMRLALVVLPEPATEPAPATSDAWMSGEPIDITATEPPPGPRASMLLQPTIRVEPAEVGARPGASVVLTLFVTNPRDAPLAGHARVDAAPLEVALDDPAFVAAARDEALVTFVVTIPEDVAIGSSYDGLATTSLSEAAVPFTIRIEGAEARPQAPSADGAPLSLLVAAAGASVALVGASAAWRRWPALGLLPLYARLAPSRALEHPRRAAMLLLLRSEPGLTLADVRRRMGMSNGVARHHVALLEAAGVVRIVSDGALRRLWLVGDVAKPVPPLRERALDALRAAGAMRASELADALGVSRQSLHYHLKRLVDEGRIVAQRDGIEVVLRPA